MPVRVRANNREICTYALLDSGANKSFCEKVLFERLEISNPDTVAYSINTLEQWFSIGGARRDFLGCELLFSTSLLYKQQYIKWCKGCKNDFSFRTGCGLQNELRTGALERDEPIAVNTVSIPVTILPLHEEEEIQLPQVLVTDAIPASPNCLPDSRVLEDLEYLKGVALPKLEEGTVTLLIGNDNVYAHRCLECRFSPDPSKYPDAVRTPLGWLLKGPALVDPHQRIDPDSVFFTNVDNFWHAQELRRVYSRLQYFFLSVRSWFVLLTLKSTHFFSKT